jgi:hypothetical protein
MFRRCDRVSLLPILVLAGCTTNVPVLRTGPDPSPDGGNGSNMSNNSGPDAATTTPTPDAGSPCALQPGTYHEVFATTDSSCAAIPARDLPVGAGGTIDPDTGCTASSTPSCVTTFSCAMSTLTLTTGGTTATGSEMLTVVTSAPPGCGASIFCPGGYCLYQGYCLPDSSTYTCTYSVTLTKL